MKKAKRILVGLKMLEHTVALTDAACRLGAKTASLFLVHVIELPDPTPLDADVPDLEAIAAKILQTGERVARRGGMKVLTSVLRARNAGEALLDEMKEKKADLGVIGYHHHRTFGEILLGTSAQHLMKHAPCHLVCIVPPHVASGR
jgi:nucleotide-binding universal stress UspA family protein